MNVEKVVEGWTLQSLVASTAIDCVPELCWVRTTRFIISLSPKSSRSHTLSLFHPSREGEEEEKEEGERPGERGHLLVHLGLRRRYWKSPSFLETLLCADLQEEEKVIVSDEELEPGRDSLRKALVLGLASFSETVPGAWHFCRW